MSPIERSAGGGGGGGLTSIPTAVVVGNGAGDLSTASVTFVDLPGIATSIAAATGDVILCFFMAQWSIGAAPVNGFFELQATTSGTNIKQCTAFEPSAGNTVVAVLVALYTVAVGDLAAGSIAIKSRFATASNTITVQNTNVLSAPTLGLVNLKH